MKKIPKILMNTLRDFYEAFISNNHSCKFSDSSARLRDLKNGFMVDFGKMSLLKMSHLERCPLVKLIFF